MTTYVVRPICCILFALSATTLCDPFQECRKSAKFSTKTGYNQLPKIKVPVKQPANYTAIQINMVHRHGERFPGAKDVKEMKEFALKINKFKNISKSVNLTLPWHTTFQEIENKMLAKEGETTLYELGKRIRQRFPEAFTKTYTTYNYKFLSTCLTRTTGSAAALSLGLFEGYGHLGPSREQPIHLEVTPCNKDIVLRAQDNCAKYITEVYDNDDASIEVKKYQKGKEVRNVIDEIKMKFGEPNMSLSYDEIKLMYGVCSWDLIMFNGSLSKGMCSMFTQDELSVIEYGEDIDDYYMRSNAYNISYQSSCPLLRDVLQSLQAQAGRNVSYNKYSGLFRSGHSDTVLPFYAMLGVYTNRIPLLSTNYLQNENRTFLVGCLVPFSANLYFVLYKKDGNNEVNDYKIQLYVNERLTQIPGCQSMTDCNFATFEKHYQGIVNRCDYQKMCQNKLSPTSPPTNNAHQKHG